MTYEKPSIMQFLFIVCFCSDQRKHKVAKGMIGKIIHGSRIIMFYENMLHIIIMRPIRHDANFMFYVLYVAFFSLSQLCRWCQTAQPALL